MSPTPPSAKECISEPHIPMAAMRTCTSPGPGSGISCSESRNAFNPTSSATFIRNPARVCTPPHETLDFVGEWRHGDHEITAINSLFAFKVEGDATGLFSDDLQGRQ